MLFMFLEWILQRLSSMSLVFRISKWYMKIVLLLGTLAATPCRSRMSELPWTFFRNKFIWRTSTRDLWISMRAVRITRLCWIGMFYYCIEYSFRRFLLCSPGEMVWDAKTLLIWDTSESTTSIHSSIYHVHKTTTK
jgi:hypothetical protein